MSTTKFIISPSIVNWCIEKQKNVSRVICFVRSDGSISMMPSAQRGNSTYAFNQSERLVEIAYCLNTKIQTQYTDGVLSGTNQFFVTLTASYDYENPSESWDKVADAFRSFYKKLKNYYKTVDYMCVKEAHLKGGLHLHSLISLGKVLPVVQSDVLMTNKEDRTQYHTVKSYENFQFSDLVSNLWSGSIGAKSMTKCLGINNSVDMYQYLYKEFAKCGSISNSLRFFGTPQFNDLDVHRLLTFYYSSVNGVKRTLQCSNGLRYDKCGGFPFDDVTKVNNIALHVLGGMFDFDRIIEKYGRVRLDTEIRNNCHLNEDGTYTVQSVTDYFYTLTKMKDFNNPVVSKLFAEYILNACDYKTSDYENSLFHVTNGNTVEYNVYNVDSVN